MYRIAQEKTCQNKNNLLTINITCTGGILGELFDNIHTYGVWHYTAVKPVGQWPKWRKKS